MAAVAPVPQAASANLPGWYGKLPFLGDFASRRLPSSFVRAWDDWLQTVIYGSRSILGDEWLQFYLTSPVWHFCLSPGICGDKVWFGLLMPSVDRANRHFPFTLAHGMPREALHDVGIGAYTKWQTQLEPEALSMLDLDGSVERLEGRLLEFAPPSGLEDTVPPPSEHLQSYFNAPRYAYHSELPGLVTAMLHASMKPGTAPLSLWWNNTSDPESCVAWLCRSLPTADRYSFMISEAVT